MGYLCEFCVETQMPHKALSMTQLLEVHVYTCIIPEWGPTQDTFLLKVSRAMFHGFS